MNSWPTLILAGTGALLIAAGIVLRRAEQEVTAFANTTGEEWP